MPDQQPMQEPTSRTQEMLLEFLRDNDAPCPVCGYNLRALTRPVCPECRQNLILTVGVDRLRLFWLLAAVAPGFFSGIAACFVLIPIVGVYVEDGVLIWPFIIIDAFGWGSGIFAILLAAKRHRFLALSRSRQRWLALLIWAVHIGALVLLIFTLAPYV